jgi:hypothetical protein
MVACIYDCTAAGPALGAARGVAPLGQRQSKPRALGHVMQGPKTAQRYPDE